jgi:hypothetical protein
MSDLVVRQLRHLAGTLTVLRGRVREAVASEVGRAVADAVAEVLTAALGGRLARLARLAGHRHPYGHADWDDSDPYDWDDDYRATRSEAPDERADRRGPVDNGPSPEVALAVALAAGRWGLGRRGSKRGAAVAGLAAGAALLAGGPAVRTALGVLWAVDRLLAATDALGDGARALDRA